MKRSSIGALIGLLIALLLLPAPSFAQTPTSGDPLRVVASFSILGDLVENVGGDAVEVATLIRPGVDAHTYDPAPADLVVLSEADLVFENGLGFEPWLDQFFASTQPPGTRVVVTEGITPLEVGEAEAGEHREEEDSHDHGQLDPHVWHDVANVILMVGNIRDALAAVDPARAESYEANAEAYIAELNALDRSIRQQVGTLPEERRKLVSSHDTFGYFAAAYGFEVIGTALGSLSTEAGDPSARDIAMLISEIEAAGVPAIFAENVANPDLMESIAAEAGVDLAPPLYTDALGPPGSPGDNYIGMVQSNVTTIVDALSGDRG
ncbi:MAG TPA: zinc ABC transporter substrate-binding protein [Thermomicrobiales bacterium]|nr:zinc ABC transporter substrate-binding protein [Thermomicrobiales bacterium]